MNLGSYCLQSRLKSISRPEVLVRKKKKKTSPLPSNIHLQNNEKKSKNHPKKTLYLFIYFLKSYNSGQQKTNNVLLAKGQKTECANVKHVDCDLCHCTNAAQKLPGGGKKGNRKFKPPNDCFLFWGCWLFFLFCFFSCIHATSKIGTVDMNVYRFNIYFSTMYLSFIVYSPPKLLILWN